MPKESGTGLDDTSNPWVIPAGGVHVAPLENECEVTIMSLADVVLKPGAV